MASNLCGNRTSAAHASDNLSSNEEDLEVDDSHDQDFDTLDVDNEHQHVIQATRVASQAVRSSGDRVQASFGPSPKRSRRRSSPAKEWSIHAKKDVVQQIKQKFLTHAQAAEKYHIAKSTLSGWYAAYHEDCTTSETDFVRKRNKREEYPLVNSQVHIFLSSYTSIYLQMGFCFSKSFVQGSAFL